MSHLIAYRVAPQCERKAARELRENGRRAYLPLEVVGKRKAPVARGYIFSDPKPAFAKHVRSAVGAVTRGDLARLYPERKKPAMPQRVHADGASVLITKGIAEIKATVCGYRDRMYFVRYSLLGKDQRQAIHEMHVKPGSS
jgi:hypothetical protein